MPPSSPTMLLAAWERGIGRDWIAHGLALLGLAFPERTADELASIPIGLRDRALLGVREAAFGSRMSGLATCQTCGDRLEFECAVGDLRARESADAELCVRAEGFVLRLRRPTSADLRAALDAGPAGEQLLFTRCVAEVLSGEAAVTVDTLPGPAIDAAIGRLAEIEAQADMHVALACPNCSERWSAPFDIVTFLWAELEAFAQQLLDDVHALASAYGWCERDILDLPATRRQRYLARVHA